MRKLLVQSSVVVVAHDVNLSIFKPAWLVRNGVLREEETEGELVVTPVAVHIPTTGFTLMVVPNRIQLTFAGPAPGSRALVDRVGGGIIRTLPHTPYTACGLNFHYLLQPDVTGAFEPWCRRLFACPAASSICPKEGGARFGCYVSFDALNGRLKLDIKPVRTATSVAEVSDRWRPDEEAMQVNFNYDFQLGDGPSRADVALEAIGRWDEAVEHAAGLLGLVAA